jgi:transmembrane sensor
MIYYEKYNLEDFLSDEQFRSWAIHGDKNFEAFWLELGEHYPAKRVIMEQACELLRTWNQARLKLSDDEVENQVSRILEATETEPEKQHAIWYRKEWIYAAAALVLTLGFGWLILLKPQAKEPTSEYQHYVAEAVMPIEEVVNSSKVNMLVKLPDSSTITLSPSSRISYAQTFIHNKKREVYLEGEAFFDVKKDALNPFFVYSHGLVTRVLGTSFLVKSTDANVEVLVKSGRVSVLAMKDIDSQNNRNTEMLLMPNQQAIFSTKDNLISKSISSTPLELIKLETRSGFVFRDQPIHKVFAALEKVYGIPIVFDSTLMENCALHVELSNEPFFTKLDIISQTIGASYRISDGQVIISSEGCE